MKYTVQWLDVDNQAQTSTLHNMPDERSVRQQLRLNFRVQKITSIKSGYDTRRATRTTRQLKAAQLAPTHYDPERAQTSLLAYIHTNILRIRNTPGHKHTNLNKWKQWYEYIQRSTTEYR